MKRNCYWDLTCLCDEEIQCLLRMKYITVVFLNVLPDSSGIPLIEGHVYIYIKVLCTEWYPST